MDSNLDLDFHIGNQFSKTKHWTQSNLWPNREHIWWEVSFSKCKIRDVLNPQNLLHGGFVIDTPHVKLWLFGYFLF